MKIDHRDPHTLRRSGLHKSGVPAPDKASPEWIAFIETVRNDGRIREAIRGNTAGLVFDGWWRVEAAKDLQLAQVPYEAVPDHDEALLIVESLTARKHMQVSGRVYLAIGVLGEYASAAEDRRVRNLSQKRKTAEEKVDPRTLATDQAAPVSGTGQATIRYLATRFGCSKDAIQKARELRSFFHDPKFFALWLKKNSIKAPAEQHAQMQADLRAEFEPLLFNASKSLWDVLQAVAGRLTGARKEPQVEQLDLFFGGLTKLEIHLRKLNEDGLDAATKRLPGVLAELPALLEVLERACAKARSRAKAS